MTREDEIRQEIASITAWLTQNPGADSFVSQLTNAQMERRLEALRQRLLESVNRTLELRFADSAQVNRTAISSSVLSQLLGRFQGTLTFGTWAMGSGPNVEGNIPVAVERSAATEVVATPEGSFRLVLRKQELDINPNFDKSVESVLDIARAATSNELNEDTEAKAQELGREATHRLQSFFRRLSEVRLDTEFTWQSPEAEADVFVDHSTAKVLSSWLGTTIPTVEIVPVRGYLRRADSLTGSFKIESEATGQLYEGTGDVEVLAHTEIDGHYDSQIEVETLRSPHTGRTREKMRLISLISI